MRQQTLKKLKQEESKLDQKEKEEREKREALKKKQQEEQEAKNANKSNEKEEVAEDESEDDDDKKLSVGERLKNQRKKNKELEAKIKALLQSVATFKRGIEEENEKLKGQIDQLKEKLRAKNIAFE